MKKKIQIYAVYNVQPNVMTALLKTIKGVRFNEPKVNENNFCEVEIINATRKQWLSIMSLF